MIVESPSPFLGVHISERFREYPLMTSYVLCDVLSLAKFEIGQFHDDASAICTGVLAMGLRICDTDHDLMGDFVLVRRSSVRADITNNYCPIAYPELRAMVFANLKTFFKPERLT